MKQKDVVNKILIELLKRQIIDYRDELIMMGYLEQAYAAGFDYSRKQSTNHKPVVQYSLDNKPIRVFDSAQAAKRSTGVDPSDIGRCAKGKARTAGGFKWRFIDSSDDLLK